MRKLFIGFLCVVFFVVATPVNAKTLDYEIITYNFTADITQSRIAKIDEKYSIYFMNKLDSIDRKLNDKLTILRPDGSKILNYIDISKVKSTSKYKYKNNVLTIENNVLKEEVNEFELSYNYNLGKDNSSKYDELYLNILDGTLNANISNVNFEIKLPNNFDNSKVKFLIDDSYEISKDDVVYKIENNVIKGTLSTFLTPYQKFSIRVELKDGYFKNASDNYNYSMFLIILLPLIGLFVGIFGWFKYARKNKFTGEITVKVPHDYDSAEIGFIYNGYSKEHDMVSVLIKLANEGYLMFDEDDDGYKLERPNSFKIIKLKNYTGNNAIQKLLFEKLFEKNDVVETKDIEYNLYETLFKSKETLDNKENREMLFYKDIKIFKKILIGFIFVSCLIINIHSSHEMFNTYLLAPVVALTLILGIYIVFIMDSRLVSKIIIGGILIGVTLFLGVSPISNDLMTVIIYFISLILILLGSTLYKLLPNRTPLGNAMLGEVSGFKIGLENMTKEEMKNNLEINPNYFYDMYPYVYVFNMTEIWNYKGSEYVKEFPSWYKTKEEFSLQNFQKFCRNMIYITTQAMYKRQTPGMSGTHVEYKKTSRVQQLEER